MIDAYLLDWLRMVEEFLRDNVVTLTLLYAGLKWLAPRTKTKIDDKLLKWLAKRLGKDANEGTSTPTESS